MNTLDEIQRITVKDLADLGLIKLQQGYVVVETNFRLYAYSTSKLHYQQNAHPRVVEKVPSVPENVTDQIRLWESDLIKAAHFFDDFPSRVLGTDELNAYLNKGQLFILFLYKFCETIQCLEDGVEKRKIQCLEGGYVGNYH
ncbi:hypothetical protein LXL04_004511 [Taraxacum kok-saghyz]